MTLAEHIIEATPERIKRENFPAADSLPLDTSGVTSTMNWLANYLGDVEQLPSIIHLRYEVHTVQYNTGLFRVCTLPSGSFRHSYHVRETLAVCQRSELPMVVGAAFPNHIMHFTFTTSS